MAKRPCAFFKMSTAISTLYDPLRHILGDRNASLHVHEDSVLLAGVKTVIQMGKVPGYSLTQDLLSITPTFADANAFALTLLYVALSFSANGIDGWSWRTRGLAKSFDGSGKFVAYLMDEIHALENGTMFGSWQAFNEWSQGMIGVPLGASLCKVNDLEDSATVSVM